MRKAAAKEDGQYVANVCRSTTYVAQTIYTAIVCGDRWAPALSFWNCDSECHVCECSTTW